MTDNERCQHGVREDVPELYYSLADRLAGVLSRLAVGGNRPTNAPEASVLPGDERPNLTSREHRQLQETLRGSMSVLSHLVVAGGEATATELRESTGLSGARVSNICTALEEKGLIERSHRHKDRRKVTIELTQEGREFAEEKMDFVRGVIADFLWDLGEDDSRELVDLLGRVLDVIEQRRGSVPPPRSKAAAALFAVVPPPPPGPLAVAEALASKSSEEASE